jgi:flagellar hook-length control protein FliK
LETLLTLKQELVNIKGIDTKPLTQLIDKLLNLQNLFTKIDLPNLNQSGFQSNFATNLDSLLTTLKTSIQNLSSSNENLNLHQNINKTIHKLETIINNLIQNPNNFLPKESNPIQNDMKALLLQVQAELISKGDSNSQETIKQIDRLITQIEYHQLQSLVSNSNNVYIPFLWDMLDEGSISMKKINEDKFYCEINLSLKEFGETNLLLALYDKNKLDLTIYASKNSFKETLQKSLPKLRSSLNSVDLIPVNIKIVDIKKEDTKEQKQMNQFNQNNDFINPNFGIDIRV